MATGSREEVEDLKKAYMETDGSIDDIMTHIPHSTYEDEARFIIVISDLVKKGDLPLLGQWDSSTKDEKAKLVRKKQADKEAAEAEALAKELGVWDEFYGSGKPGARKTKGKGKGKQQQADEEEDTSALQALILKKRKNMDSFLDNLAAKYAEPESGSRGGKKGKKRAKATDEDEEAEMLEASPKKKSRKEVPTPPDIDDAEFEKIQQRLMEGKAQKAADGGGTSRKGSAIKGRGTKGRKAK